MRKLMLLAIFITAPVLAREAPKPPLGATDCRNASVRLAQTERQAGPQKMGELPDPQLIRAVDYRERGCSKPISVNRTLRR